MCIAEQLQAGVSTERILNDARKVGQNGIERKNLLTRCDIKYLMTKFNIEKKRHQDDMLATELKVKEWNKDGKNVAFLFKKIGMHLLSLFS